MSGGALDPKHPHEWLMLKGGNFAKIPWAGLDDDDIVRGYASAEATGWVCAFLTTDGTIVLTWLVRDTDDERCPFKGAEMFFECLLLGGHEGLHLAQTKEGRLRYFPVVARRMAVVSAEVGSMTKVLDNWHFDWDELNKAANSAMAEEHLLLEDALHLVEPEPPQEQPEGRFSCS